MPISGENVKLEVLLAKVQEDLSLLISKGSLRTPLLQNGVRFRKINARKFAGKSSKQRNCALHRLYVLCNVSCVLLVLFMSVSYR